MTHLERGAAGVLGLVVLLSLAHLAGGIPGIDPPTRLLGGLGWAAVLSGLAVAARGIRTQTAVVFLAFAALGFAIGAYLEPPGDTLEHLRRTYALCDASASDVARVNQGLWQYPMSGLLLCTDAFTATPERTLRSIDLLNGLYQGILASALLVAARGAGLPLRWCVFALLAAFLFFGTNRIAYFRYFALGPTSTSMAVYWLWIGAFFFRSEPTAIRRGALAAAALLPVLVVNHRQEAIFLALVAGIWLALAGHRRLWPVLRRTGPAAPALYAVALFGVFFVAPQIEAVQQALSRLFIERHWQENQHLLLALPFYLAGNPLDFRVGDTLGLLGYLPLLLVVPLLWPGPSRPSPSATSRMLVLALLPFVVLLVPLLAFVWISNAKAVVYWRIAYASLFWLPLAAAGWRLERKVGGRAVFAACAAALVALSAVRAGPVYGKLGFLLVDGRPWWPAWQEVVASVHEERKTQRIHSDHVTVLVAQDVFGGRSLNPVERKGRRALVLEPGYIDPLRMERIAAQGTHQCVINLIGFEPTWVPHETRHWNPTVADTARAYRLDPRPGDPSGLTRLARLRHCRVFRP